MYTVNRVVRALAVSGIGTEKMTPLYTGLREKISSDCPSSCMQHKPNLPKSFWKETPVTKSEYTFFTHQSCRDANVAEKRQARCILVAVAGYLTLRDLESAVERLLALMQWSTHSV